MSSFFFVCLKTFFLVIQFIKGIFHFIILQTLWERYFCVFSDRSEQGSNI